MTLKICHHQSCAYTRSKVTLVMKESLDHMVSHGGTVLRHILPSRNGGKITFFMSNLFKLLRHSRAMIQCQGHNKIN